MAWTRTLLDAWHRACEEYVTGPDLATGAAAVETFINDCPASDKSAVAALAPVLQFMRRHAGPNGRLKSLEERITKLEQQRGPSCTYEGVFQDGKFYDCGALTTRRGGIWLALQRTAETPGTGHSDHWRLICKEGRA